jgi:hypothetical protein
MRRDRVTDVAQLLCVLWAAANPVRPPSDDRAPRGQHPHARLTVRHALPAARGASDLAFDPAGRGWLVTERAHTLVPLDGGAAWPIRGVPEGIDLEGLAFTSSTSILLATERHGPRSQDVLLEARLEADQAVVVGQRIVDYAALGLQAAMNAGLEGVCVAGGHVVAALETPQLVGDTRRAALWVDGRVVTLPLSTRTGKLSAVACRALDDTRLALWLIERHYGVSVILTATLAPGATTLAPTVYTNLGASFDGPIPNLEGLAVHDGALWLANDDDPSPAGTVTRVWRLEGAPVSGP